jgi:hypothetical protein
MDIITELNEQKRKVDFNSYDCPNVTAVEPNYFQHLTVSEKLSELLSLTRHENPWIFMPGPLCSPCKREHALESDTRPVSSLFINAHLIDDLTCE